MHELTDWGLSRLTAIVSNLAFTRLDSQNTHHMEASLPQGLFQLLAMPRHFPRSMEVQSGNFDRAGYTCFDRNDNSFASDLTSFNKNAPSSTEQLLSARDFTVLLRMLFGTYSSSWIHSEIISVAAFHIIGLAKISRIEFLPLDWIYHSIRTMTV